MHYLIYKITNKINGKIYIGKHKTLNENDDYLGSSKLLNGAIKKYGISNFHKEILYRLENEKDMNEKEANIVDDQFVAREDTYNLSLGGSGGWEYVNKNKLNGSCIKTSKWVKSSKTNWQPMKNKFLELIHNDSSFKKKFSDSIKKRYARDGHPWTGRKHTNESKAKMASYDRSGKKSPSYGKMWINNGTVNKKISKTATIPHSYKKGRLYKSKPIEPFQSSTGTI